jgi:hypothetical protein
VHCRLTAITRTECSQHHCLQLKDHSLFDRCFAPATWSTPRLHTFGGMNTIVAVNNNATGWQQFCVYFAPLRASRSSARAL